MIHAGCRPWIRMIRAKYDLSHATYRNEMLQGFAGEYERIDIELLQILCRAFVELFCALLGEGQASMIRPVRVGKKKPSSMSSADLQPRKTVQRSLEDQ